MWNDDFLRGINETIQRVHPACFAVTFYARLKSEAVRCQLQWLSLPASLKLGQDTDKPGEVISSFPSRPHGKWQTLPLFGPRPLLFTHPIIHYALPQRPSIPNNLTCDNDQHLRGNQTVNIQTKRTTPTISRFRRDVDDFRALLVYYESSKVKKSLWDP